MCSCVQAFKLRRSEFIFQSNLKRACVKQTAYFKVITLHHIKKELQSFGTDHAQSKSSEVRVTSASVHLDSASFDSLYWQHCQTAEAYENTKCWKLFQMKVESIKNQHE